MPLKLGDLTIRQLLDLPFVTADEAAETAEIQANRDAYQDEQTHAFVERLAEIVARVAKLEAATPTPPPVPPVPPPPSGLRVTAEPPAGLVRVETRFTLSNWAAEPLRYDWTIDGTPFQTMSPVLAFVPQTAKTFRVEVAVPLTTGALQTASLDYVVAEPTPASPPAPIVTREGQRLELRVPDHPLTPPVG